MDIKDPHTQVVMKSAPAITPGVLTGLANWLDFIETGLSIALLVFSLAFLLWRWRVAYKKEKEI